MNELEIPTDGRVTLSITSLEGEPYFDGELSIRSGTEVDYRVSEEETAGLNRLGPKELIRVSASKPRR